MTFSQIIPFVSLIVSLIVGLIGFMVKMAINRLESDRLSRDKILEELKGAVNTSTLESVKLITKLQSSVDHMIEDRNRIQGEVNETSKELSRISTLQEVMRQKLETIGERAEYACSRNHELSNKVQQLMNK